MLDHPGTAHAIADEALDGLTRFPKTLPAKLFYDDDGCRLFEAITRLPEYYPTRTELALLREVGPLLASPVPTVLVEYGASDETKASLLFPQLRLAGYVPIDVAEGALEALVVRLAAERPALPVHPVAADFLSTVLLPRIEPGQERLGFFPGSTIGNLQPDAAVRFLRQAGEALGPRARFLVGVDLRKDADMLVRAYDDASGVTAAFNLNLLARLNREAAAGFDLDAFQHRAIWNDEESRIEMHLVSLRRQAVPVGGTVVRFERGETIHTENSYKHTLPGFRALAEAGGWRVDRQWTDPYDLFSLHLLAGFTD